MTEVWKDIEGYEGLYKVSSEGIIMGLCGIIRPNKIGRGYFQVGLHKDGKQKNFLVHRLVAEAFIPNPLHLPYVNHKSEIKTDNRVENLEFCDHKYNINYGTRNKRAGEKLKNGKSSKPILQFSKTGEFICEWASQCEIERQLGFFQGGISMCCRGKCKSAYGYIWKYK